MSVIWGCPYLLIRIAVREISPATLIFLRTAPAALVLAPDRPAPAAPWSAARPVAVAAGLHRGRAGHPLALRRPGRDPPDQLGDRPAHRLGAPGRRRPLPGPRLRPLRPAPDPRTARRVRRGGRRWWASTCTAPSSARWSRCSSRPSGYAVGPLIISRKLDDLAGHRRHHRVPGHRLGGLRPVRPHPPPVVGVARRWWPRWSAWPWSARPWPSCSSSS